MLELGARGSQLSAPVLWLTWGLSREHSLHGASILRFLVREKQRLRGTHTA